MSGMARTVAIGVVTGASAAALGSLAVLGEFGAPFWFALTALTWTWAFTSYACTTPAIYRALRRKRRREHRRVYGIRHRWDPNVWRCDCKAWHPYPQHERIPEVPR